MSTIADQSTVYDPPTAWLSVALILIGLLVTRLAHAWLAQRWHEAGRRIDDVHAQIWHDQRPCCEPYDQEADPRAVGDEAEKWLRGQA